jgi:hypothetical protein
MPAAARRRIMAWALAWGRGVLVSCPVVRPMVRNNSPFGSAEILLFGAFDHLFPRIRSDGQSESHPDSRMQFTPMLGAVVPQAFDSMRWHAANADVRQD